MNGSHYYASMAITAEELKTEDIYQSRNLWWRVMFPRTAGLHNKRNPQRSTLLMLLRSKWTKAHEALLIELGRDQA